MSATNDGWFADPTGRHQQRYMSGGQWTEHVSDDGATATDPLDAATAPAAGVAPGADPTAPPETGAGPTAPAAPDAPDAPAPADRPAADANKTQVFRSSDLDLAPGQPRPGSPAADSPTDAPAAPPVAPPPAAAPPVAPPPAAAPPAAGQYAQPGPPPGQYAQPGPPPGPYPPGAPVGAPGPAAYGAPPGGSAAAPRRRPIIGFVLVAIGVVLTIVGAVLPWVKATGVLEFTKAGTEGDGVITLVLGGLAGLLAVVMVAARSRIAAVFVGLLGLCIAGVAVIDIADVNNKVGDAAATVPADVLQASVGIGLWITAVAAGLVVVGAIAGMARR